MHSGRSAIARVTAVVVTSGLLSAAGGAVWPYLILYLHFSRNISTPLAGSIVAMEGVATLGGALVGGVLVDRFGARNTATLGTFVEVIGYLLVFLARTPPLFFVASLVFGFSNIRYSARNVATANALPADLPAAKFFSYDFMASNAGFAVGTLTGGLFINLHRPSTFLDLLLLGMGCGILAAFAFVLLPNDRHVSDHPVEPSYREALTDPRLRLFLIFAVFLSFTSYASFDTGIPALIGIALHKSPQVIAIGFVINPVLIVLLQRPVYGLINKIGFRRALKLTALVFGIAWLIPLVTVFAHTTVFVLADLAVFAAIFGFGEMCYSPIRTPVLLALAPKRLRGRYFGLSQFSRALANVIGPVTATEAVGHGLAYIWLGGLFALGSMNAAIGSKLGRQVEEGSQQSNAEEPTVQHDNPMEG
ncbi:MFS transporter [Ferrimicrobium acidiphilum]|uniref:MFS transporter n=1 Tax=Ferrimicrobium acidiphilum TaxID=121039 RepID=UPI0023F51E4C|nr:MFS transporter [Ferrimicrobium acidiphilum]